MPFKKLTENARQQRETDRTNRKGQRRDCVAYEGGRRAESTLEKHPPEVPCIACCLEPNKVCAKDAAQEVLPYTEASVGDITSAMLFNRCLQKSWYF